MEATLRPEEFPEFAAFARALDAEAAPGPPAWAVKPVVKDYRADAPAGASKQTFARAEFPNSTARRVERTKELTRDYHEIADAYARVKKKRVAANARAGKKDVLKIGLGKLAARPRDRRRGNQRRSRGVSTRPFGAVCGPDDLVERSARAGDLMAPTKTRGRASLDGPADVESTSRLDFSELAIARGRQPNFAFEVRFLCASRVKFSRV